MKVTFKGDALTPELVASAMRSMEKEYGLHIRSLTAYIRFEDESGRLVDVVKDGAPIENEFVFNPMKGMGAKEPADHDDPVMSPDEIIENLQSILGRPLMAFEMEMVAAWVTDLKITKSEFSGAVTGFDAEDNLRVLQRKLLNACTKRGGKST